MEKGEWCKYGAKEGKHRDFPGTEKRLVLLG